MHVAEQAWGHPQALPRAWSHAPPWLGAPLTPVRELLVVAVLLPMGQWVQEVATAAVLDHVFLEAGANAGLGVGDREASDMTSDVPT